MSELKQEYYDDLTRQYESATSERERSAIAKKIRDFEYMFPDFFSREPELPLPAHQYSPLKNPFEYERSQLDPGMHTIRGKETMDGTRTRFDRGGTLDEENMDAQMELSGLVKEKTDIDPVSGNEIPLGATAEGVRDDQTAALSAGEFVIPDYAVRYHGVDFYMKSLATAKVGLQQMDKMGMTGKPDEATMSDDQPLPTMNENEDSPMLEQPVDTEMFFKGGFQTGGLYTTPIQQFNTPQTTLPTTTTPMGPTQVARPVSTQVTPPTYSPTTTPITYPQYQGPGAGVPGGYGIKAYKNPKTGKIIYLTTIGGKLPPGTNIPAGFMPIEEAAAQQAQPPAPTPPTTEIDRGGVTEHDLEMEAKKDEEEQERELQERIDARKSAIAKALADQKSLAESPFVPGGGAEYGAYTPVLVDPKYGMWIDGVYTRDPNELKPYEDSKARSLITNESPFGQILNSILKVVFGSPAIEVAKIVVDAFGKKILSPDKETATLISSHIDDKAVEVEPEPQPVEPEPEPEPEPEIEEDPLEGYIDPRLQAAVTRKKRKEAEDATYGKVDPQLQDAEDIIRDEEEKEQQREEARKVRGEKTDTQESPYGTGTLKEDIQETYQAIDYSQRQAQQAMADRDAAAYEEALSAGGLVKKPIRKRTRKKKGKGLARSK